MPYSIASSLKATAERRRETEDDAIAGLKRAQDDYEDARADFRSPTLADDEACDNLMKRKAVAKFAGHDGDQLTDADRGNVWFCALAFVYQATSRAARQRASKHASALRLLYDQSIDADQIAKTIKERRGLQKLADEAAKARRSGTKKRVDHDNAEASAENGEASDDAEVQNTDSDDSDLRRRTARTTTTLRSVMQKKGQMRIRRFGSASRTNWPRRSANTGENELKLSCRCLGRCTSGSKS